MILFALTVERAGSSFKYQGAAFGVARSFKLAVRCFFLKPKNKGFNLSTPS